MPNPPPQEDTWAFQLYGTPFPEMPVKCFGQQNQYVALWYKHGKPIHGRAWNNNGVVEASFPYSKAELTGTRDLKGEIQVLQYKGDHLSLGYWYNWIKYKERKVKPDSERQLVKCGESMPILWASRPEGALLGYLDLATEAALFSHDKTTTKVTGNALDDMLIIVRELKGGPQTCECIECVPPVAPAAPPPPPPPPANLIMTHNWADFRTGDPFPPAKAIRALGRSLTTFPGENPDQYVALWYQSGEPVMGRIWNDKGKIAACFSWGGHEYRNSIGSIQVLLDLPERVRGYDYDWRSFKEAADFSANKEWHPVHVNHHKGDISPGVLMIDGKEMLGKVDVRNERASVGHGGTEKALVGPAVHTTKVLCRKARPGCKFD